MITTTITTDHFEVLGDVTVVDRFDDMLAEPVDCLRRLLAPSAITIPPSDLPAVELPDYEPTTADLLAIEAVGDSEIDALIASANTLSAYEARHRDLLRLRAELVIPTQIADLLDDLERVA
jgi:hypothetical protein